jgi:hypothetical protein
MLCLKINNKVKVLNLSFNKIASDINHFRNIQKFLIYNKVLEVFNISDCEINEK